MRRRSNRGRTIPVGDSATTKAVPDDGAGYGCGGETPETPSDSHRDDRPCVVDDRLGGFGSRNSLVEELALEDDETGTSKSDDGSARDHHDDEFPDNAERQRRQRNDHDEEARNNELEGDVRAKVGSSGAAGRRIRAPAIPTPPLSIRRKAETVSAMAYSPSSLGWSKRVTTIVEMRPRACPKIPFPVSRAAPDAARRRMSPAVSAGSVCGGSTLTPRLLAREPILFRP